MRVDIVGEVRDASLVKTSFRVGVTELTQELLHLGRLLIFVCRVAQAWNYR